MQHIYKPRTALDLFWRPYVCISVESYGQDVTLYVKTSPISRQSKACVTWWRSTENPLNEPQLELDEDEILKNF